MYDYFKNIADKNNCSSDGECTIHPVTNSLYEILLTQIREISYYLVKLKEFGIINKNAMARAVEALSIFFLNTNLNQTKYLNLVYELYESKTQIKEKYIEYCSSHELPSEIINSSFKIDKSTSIADLIKYFDANNAIKQKNSDKIKQRLFFLITIFAKIASLNIVKIKKFNKDFDIYDYEILRFFALTNAYSIRVEKIKRRIFEFADTEFKIKEKLFNIYKQAYGNKESSTILTTPLEGHGILVSGDDLDELQNLLEELSKLNLQEEINVYTNGSLFLAHFYPYFKNNKFLKGHYGTNNTQYDFSGFSGAILLTRNFNQKIDNLYKGEIFSNKLISFDKVFDIQNNNYGKLFETTLKLKGFSKSKVKNTVYIDYRENMPNEIFSKKLNKITIIAGRVSEEALKKIKEENCEDIFNEIININCPVESDILFETVKKLKENSIKTTIFFPQCSIETLDCVFSLLNQDINIYLSDCSYILINPHVKEALAEDFSIKII